MSTWSTEWSCSEIVKELSENWDKIFNMSELKPQLSYVKQNGSKNKIIAFATVLRFLTVQHEKSR